MKRFIASLFLFASIFIGSAISLSSCGDTQQQYQEKHANWDSHHKQQVQCYTQHTSTGELIFWYMLLRNNGSYYYYSSPTALTNYSNVNWSTNNTGFDQSAAQLQSTTEVESSGFSQEMQTEFQQSDGFDNTSDQGVESNGFENSDNSGSDNNSSGESSGSESGGFDGGGSDGGGGDGGGGE